METTDHTKTEIIARIDELNDWLWQYRNMPADSLEPGKLLEEVFEKLTQVDYPYGKARSLLNSAMAIFILQHQPLRAIERLTEALEEFRELNDRKWIANTYMTLAIIHNTIINTEQALYNGLKGIDLFENGGGNPHDAVMAYYVMGTVYKDIKQYDTAEYYYHKGLQAHDQQSMWTGRIYAGLTSIHTAQQNYDTAVQTSFKGLNILKQEKNYIGESRMLNEIGTLYKQQKNYDKALEFFFQALKLRKAIKAPQFALGSLMDIATTYYETGRASEAVPHLKEAEIVAADINMPAKLAAIYKQTGEVYKSLEQYKDAFDYYEKYVNLTLEESARESEQKLNNLKSTVLAEKEKEIEHLKNVELKNAYKIISEHNKEITDSINYARRIQHSVIMQSHDLITHIPGAFIFFKPKDIVSGDFYWSAFSQKNLMYLAVCDSTGHGVPGAFMSLLNMSFLNEAIKEQHIAQPNDILDHVRMRLIQSISQDGGKDGMDAILICYDKQNKLLTYSAANNAPLLVKQDGTIVHLPCDKMPVGKGELQQPFKHYSIDYTPGDSLYLYTDGYADQFGGPKGKKFKYKPLEEMLQAISPQQPAEQAAVLDQTFTDWKGELEQVDDICIVGIKL